MPKLTENVLVGGQVRLAGEDISEQDARGIRSEVFEQAEADPEPAESQPEAAKQSRRRSPARK